MGNQTLKYCTLPGMENCPPCSSGLALLLGALQYPFLLPSPIAADSCAEAGKLLLLLLSHLQTLCRPSSFPQQNQWMAFFPSH